jgi:hypothetical protein
VEVVGRDLLGELPRVDVVEGDLLGELPRVDVAAPDLSRAFPRLKGSGPASPARYPRRPRAGLGQERQRHAALCARLAPVIPLALIDSHHDALVALAITAASAILPTLFIAPLVILLTGVLPLPVFFKLAYECAKRERAVLDRRELADA